MCNGNDAYIEIYKNLYYIRKKDLMFTNFRRFNLTLFKEDGKMRLFSFFDELIASN